MAGYSKKALFQKLGFKPGFRVLVLNKPPQYSELLTGVVDVTFETHSGAGEFDAVHGFCPDRTTLEHIVQPALNALRIGGMFWVSWPKKSSKQYIDLTEDDIRRIVLPTGWVDVKVCAVDEDWSGLKFLKRKA